VVIAIIGVGSALQEPINAALNQPLGPTLPPFAQATQVMGATAQGDPGSLLPTPILQLSPPPAQAISNPGQPQCGGPRQLTLLLLGIDKPDKYENALSDAIRVVRLDFVEPSISVMAFPRDLWVSLPYMNGNKNLKNFMGDVVDEDGNQIYPPGDYSKLNTAYFYGYLYELPGLGPGEMANTLYVNFGVGVDNYMVVNLGVFVDVIDALGGVEINVPKDLNDYEKQWFFEAGLQHLDGARAEQYARIRHTDNDWGRIERQTQVLMAVRDKILTPEGAARVPGIVDTFIDNVKTDLSRGQISAALCLVSQTRREDVRFYEVSEDMVQGIRTTTGAAVLLPNPALVGAEIYRFLYGGR
jgi:LCP family protein required for cell wall assembly